MRQPSTENCQASCKRQSRGPRWHSQPPGRKRTAGAGTMPTSLLSAISILPPRPRASWKRPRPPSPKWKPRRLRRRKRNATPCASVSRRRRKSPRWRRPSTRFQSRWTSTRFARASSRLRGGRRSKPSGVWRAAIMRPPRKSMTTWSRVTSERVRPAPRPRRRRGSGKTIAPPRRRRWQARPGGAAASLSPEASCSSSRPWQATPWARRGRPTA